MQYLLEHKITWQPCEVFILKFEGES